MHYNGARNYGNCILLNLAHIEYLTANNHPVIAFLRREPWMLDEESGEALLSQLARTSVQRQRQTDVDALREQFLDLGSKKDYLKNLWTAVGRLGTGAKFNPHKDVSKSATARIAIQRIKVHLLKVAARLTVNEDEVFQYYRDDNPGVAGVAATVTGPKGKYRIHVGNAVQEPGPVAPFFPSDHKTSTKKWRAYIKRRWWNDADQKFHDLKADYAGRW
jgi:hypothetical protein